jgi:hypothetical protein
VLAYGTGSFSNWSITNNELYNDGHMLAVAGSGTASLNGLTMNGNYCHDEANWATSSDAWHNNCIHLYGLNASIANITISNNIMGGDPGPTMTAQIFNEPQSSVTNLLVFNNLLYWTAADEGGAHLMHISQCNSGCAIYNNTLYGSGITAGTALVFSGSGPTSISVENNIIANCFTLFSTVSSVSFTALDYNAYGVNSGEMWSYNGTLINVFATWKADSGEGPHSTYTASGVSLNSNYTPQTISPAVNGGTLLTSTGISALNFDLAGVGRPTSAAWDVGAYQHSGSSNTTVNPPTALTATVQ